MSKDKAYTVTVYRTVQQSVEVTVDTDREEAEHLRRKAEDLAEKLSDYQWKTEEVDEIYASMFFEDDDGTLWPNVTTDEGGR